jgi:hypothetical protein
MPHHGVCSRARLAPSSTGTATATTATTAATATATAAALISHRLLQFPKRCAGLEPLVRASFLGLSFSSGDKSDLSFHTLDLDPLYCSCFTHVDNS